MPIPAVRAALVFAFVKLLKTETLVPPIDCVAVPLKTTVPVPAVKAPPLLVQLPLTVNIFEAKPKLAPLVIVIFRQTLEADNIGCLAAGAIVTSVIAVGKTLPHQFPATFQSVLIPPNQ